MGLYSVYSLLLASSTQYNVLETHPYPDTYQYFIPFYGCIIFYYTDMTLSVDLLTGNRHFKYFHFEAVP